MKNFETAVKNNMEKNKFSDEQSHQIQKAIKSSLLHNSSDPEKAFMEEKSRISKLIDKTLKDFIHNNASENEISEYVFKDNQSIDQASVDLITSGVTSCEEIIRINNIQEDASI